MNSPMKLLPLLIIVSVLSFSVRLTEVIVGVSNISGAAFAESEAKTNSEHGDKKNLEDEKNSHTTKDNENSANKKSEAEIVKGKESNEPKWRDASDSDLDISGVKLELFNDLSKRRSELQKREKELQVRDALLKAAEKEIDRKYRELSKLRKEIESLLETQSNEETKRINSLVKIYEGMKPKDAARIFDTLDLDVLISVVSKMSERKVSPILAAMKPERVRTITIMLAEQKKLPTLR